MLIVKNGFLSILIKFLFPIEVTLHKYKENKLKVCGMQDNYKTQNTGLNKHAF